MFFSSRLSRSSRRMATVMICAPDASTDSTISSFVRCRPVPTMRRESNSLPAMISLSLSSIVPLSSVTRRNAALCRACAGGVGEVSLVGPCAGIIQIRLVSRSAAKKSRPPSQPGHSQAPGCLPAYFSIAETRRDCQFPPRVGSCWSSLWIPAGRRQSPLYPHSHPPTSVSAPEAVSAIAHTRSRLNHERRKSASPTFS